MYKVYGTTTKKMLNMLILEILEVYSDEQHPLTQQEILRLLKSEYGVEHCDRRSVKANVLSLVDMGYEISMEEGEGNAIQKSHSAFLSVRQKEGRKKDEPYI
jgi:hypothetical protein